MAEARPEDMLADLRVEIDRIDAAMHALLIERSTIINTLIAIKEKQGGGSAFRPGREASMMRAMAQRHEGLLPLGFTVPFVVHHGPSAVISAVGASAGDLGMVRIEAGPSGTAWWTDLIAPGAPKIIARLPFVERPDHPAGMPVFVLSKPLAEAAARDVLIRVVTIDRWREPIHAGLHALGGEMLGSAAEGMGLSLLVATPGSVGIDMVRNVFTSAGVGDIRIHDAGRHAARFDYGAHQRAAK